MDLLQTYDDGDEEDENLTEQWHPSESDLIEPGLKQRTEMKDRITHESCENSDFLGLGTDQKQMKDTDETSCILEGKSDCNKTTDFFGLATCPEDVYEEIPEKRMKPNTIVVNNEEVNIPNSTFWEAFSPQSVVYNNNKQLSDGNRGKSKNSISSIHQKPHDKLGSQKMEHKKSLSLTAGQKASQTYKSINKPKSSEIMSNIKDSEDHTNDTQKQRQLFYIHSKITPHLTRQNGKNRYPQKLEKEMPGYCRTVNRVSWNKQCYSHLFLSVSMDTSIKIWNIWSQLDPCLKTLSVHSKAVKDANWSKCGKKILSCSYDRTACWTDVETGKKLSTYRHSSFVTSCKIHPSDPNLCITGSHNRIDCWDNRTPESVVRHYYYKDKFGQIQDLLFNRDGNSFFSVGDEISQDTADRNVMAWDFTSGTVLSNQIYQERYSCTRLKLHPSSGHFLAQSHGNYIALFSTNRPYKMNKAKRFEGHKLAGYSLGFDVCPDGIQVITGDSDGWLYCYDYATGKLAHKLKTSLDVVMDVSFHPLLPSTLVSCGWNGNIQVWH